MLAVIVAVAIVVAAALFIVKPSPPFTKYLKHSSVESYIDSTYHVSGATCNGGSNIKIKKDKTFDCTAGGKTFTVTMTDNKGAYTTMLTP